jgi:glycosyltransferase involved in cell wall biosynthesis
MSLGKMGRGLSSLISLIRFPLILAKIMRIIRDENIRLIHVHCGFVPLVLSCIISNIKRIPVILTIHGGQPSFFFRFNPFCQTHGIISTSLEQKQALPQECKEVAIIPLPVDLDRFSPNSSVDTTKRLHPRICLFNSGASNPVLYSLIELAPRISESFTDAKIIITGWYSEYSEVVNKVKKMNKGIGREMINLNGFVEDPSKVMKQADIVIGVGMVVEEAMACGKPVIVARAYFGGIVNEKNVADLRKCNFTGRNSNIPTDNENIYKSISTLLNNEKYMKNVGVFGRKYAEREFEPNRLTMQIETVYRNAQEGVENAANSTSLFLTGLHLLYSILYVSIKEFSTILKLSRRIKYLSKRAEVIS